MRAGLVLIILTFSVFGLNMAQAESASWELSTDPNMEASLPAKSYSKSGEPTLLQNQMKSNNEILDILNHALPSRLPSHTEDDGIESGTEAGTESLR